MNRIDRLFAITLMLQSRRVVRGSDIAERFEISLRTVYRDLQSLSEAGIPVVAEAGVGYSLMQGFFLPPVAFNEDEATAMALGATFLQQFGGDSLGRPATDALAKIHHVLPEATKRRLDRLTRRISVFGLAQSEESTRHLGACTRASLEHRLLELSYGDFAGRSTTRQVEPLGVLLYQHHWYLIGWCRLRADMRSFRLDRIRKLTTLLDKCDPRPDFALREYLEESFADRLATRTRLAFDEPALARARRELGPSAQQWQSGKKGWTEVVVLTWGYHWLADWILSFGTGARVMDPPEMKTALRERLVELSAHHQE
jgi:predicted DNA-binding transcriptional regulator YafY